MRFALPLAATLAALAAAPAVARPAPGQIILSGCRQGECAWLRMVRVENAGRVPQGALVRMRVRRGTSTHLDGNLPAGPRGARILWERSDEDSYAFCSVRRPAFAFARSGEGLLVHFLDLFDLGGYQEASGRLYMRLCHSRGDVPRAAVLRRLGYRPGTRSEQVEDATPATMTRF
jgi:hypothetical protein